MTRRYITASRGFVQWDGTGILFNHLHSSYSVSIPLSLSLSLSHTNKHTHTLKKKAIKCLLWKFGQWQSIWYGYNSLACQWWLPLFHVTHMKRLVGLRPHFYAPFSAVMYKVKQNTFITVTESPVYNMKQITDYQVCQPLKQNYGNWKKIPSFFCPSITVRLTTYSRL